MRFLAPHWLYPLLVLPLAILFIYLDEKGRKKRFQAFASESVWRALAPEADFGSRGRKAILMILAFGFLLIAMARPEWGTHEEVAKMSGLDIIIALDVSNSMETEDVVPSRLKKAKHLIRDIVDHLGGNRVGLIAFAGSAYLACPLTTDTEYMLDSLSIQSPRIIANQGTDIELALQTADTALDRGAEAQDPHTGQAPLPTRVVLLVTDGEDHEGGAREMAQKLKADGIKLFVFGLGTEKGGPVPVRDDSGQLQGYKRDSHGQPVISSFKPNEMLKLALDGGGKYWNVSDSESEVGALMQELGTLSRGEFAEHRYLIYEERFQLPLAIAIILLLLELSLATQKRRPITKLAALFFGILMVGTQPQTVQASVLENPADTYLENKEGVEAYNAGKMEEAKKHFGAAQAREPSKSELFYNQGLVDLQGGNADAAIGSFGQAAQGAMSAGRPDILSQSLFNLGSAFSKKGDMKNALRSYLAAIEAAKQSGDSKLADDARKNIELMAQSQQEKKKQQQQQDQKDKKDQQDQKNQSEKSGDQDQKDQKDKKGEGEEKEKDSAQKQKDSDQGKDGHEQKTPQYTEMPKYDKFNSKKLTSDDAERVFSELKNRELDLQVRQKKQNANRNNNQQDW